MKALNCTLAALLMATASTAVSAQSTYMFDNPDNREYFGVRVGLNVTSAANGGAMYSNKPGFEAGAVYNMPLWKNLYFEPGLSIFYNAFGTVSYDTYEAPLPLPDGTFTTTERLFQIDGSIRNFGFRIPLTVGYHFDFSEDLKVHVFTGPQLNLSLVARYHQDGMIRFEADVDEATLLDAVGKLNADDDVDGFIVQLPLPAHISEQKVIEAIDYRKDVDGFHPINVGRQSIGLPCFHSATPAGILTLLERYNIPTKGANCVVLGRSNIVGKPVATLLMQKGYPGDATVTVCHRATKNLKEVCRQADIIIAAMGVPGFVTADMVKEGATVIDVGTTRIPDASRKSGFRLSGDVDYENVAPLCEYITPVPGGVGPMTIVSLMRNTLLAGKKAIYK